MRPIAIGKDKFFMKKLRFVVINDVTLTSKLKESYKTFRVLASLKNSVICLLTSTEKVNLSTTMKIRHVLISKDVIEVKMYNNVSR